MTNEEARAAIESLKGECNFLDFEVGCYRKCDTDGMDCFVKLSIEALEKQIPKKPTYTNERTVIRCPNCEAIHFRCLPSVEIDYCVRCGQAIDWSEVE